MIITLDEDHMGVPDAKDLLDLNDALKVLVEVMHVEAERVGTKPVWEAYLCLRAACDDIHGAAGWLAKQEGLLK